VALVSRIDKIIGLFCKRALLKRQYSAKETYNFVDPTDRSHPISIYLREDVMKKTYTSAKETYVLIKRDLSDRDP